MDSIESRYSSDGSCISQTSDQQAKLREQALDQRLSCPICLDRFSDPRLLECNHSFCRKCLLDVLMKRPRDVDEDEEETGPPSAVKLYCPKCRKVTILDPDGGIEALPSNYALKDILEVLPEDTSSFSPSTPVLPFRSLPASVPICGEHQRPLEFFCQTDDRLVCADCLVMSRHKGHDTVAAKQILENELDSLRLDSFENAERMLLKVREAVDTVANVSHSLKEKGERTKLQIQTHFKEIRDALETREQSLLDTTEDIIRRKVTKLEMQKEVLTKSREDLEMQVWKLNHILANRDDYSFLRDKRKLISDVTHTVELAQAKDRIPIESTRDGPYCTLPDDLLSKAHAFGEVFCSPCPSKFTAWGEGLSKGFVGKKANFKIEARDRYGQRSVVSGTSIKVIVQDPNHTLAPVQVEEVSKGEYQVTYVPNQVGYHLIRITADDTKILNGGNSHAVVFNKKDYLSLGFPQKVISKATLRHETPVSTMRCVCCLPSGLVVFTDAFCLRVVDPSTGLLVQTIGSYGVGNGQFSLPLGIAVNRHGHIFVSDSTNHRIVKFSSDGRYLATFGPKPGSLSNPEGLSVLGEDKLFVADCGNDRVQIFSQKNGRLQGGFGRKGTNAGQFMAPRDLAVDAKNNRILVSDTGNYRIQALTLEGRPLTEFGHPKGGSVYLSYPYLVTVDEDGFILVTETKSHYVTILTPRGALVRHLGSQGDAPGQFRTPYGICVNSSKGQVVVTDSTSHCVQIF